MKAYKQKLLENKEKIGYRAFIDEKILERKKTSWG